VEALVNMNNLYVLLLLRRRRAELKEFDIDIEEMEVGKCWKVIPFLGNYLEELA
jgi:hypothetical protein